MPVIRAGEVIVGDAVTSWLPADSGCASLANPKSSTFTTPSARTLMFAGLRSRWTIPCSCAASSASAICLAIGTASSSGIASPRDPLRQILTLDQLHHECTRVAGALEAVDLGDVGMIERRQRLRLALETRQPLGIAGQRRRQRLQRHVAAQRRVARAIDLAHPAGAERARGSRRGRDACRFP